MSRCTDLPVLPPISSVADSRRRRARRLVGPVAMVFGGLLATVAEARTAVLDCPLRDAPFSIDTPIVDLLAKPEAVALIQQLRPDVLRTLTTRMRDSKPPTFGAIITPRAFAMLKREDLTSLAPLDAALQGLKVTSADRQQRCARYDAEVPALALPPGRPRLLLFEKMTGFRDGPSVEAAAATIASLAARNGWSLVRTDKAGVMTPKQLARFDAVIWNNVSGDVLTLRQRKTFRNYIEQGGGFVGVHGSGGDPATFWDWYTDELIGARFAGHPLAPQFQRARLRSEQVPGMAANLPREWSMTDEWYSFRTNPRQTGARVLATLDESSYKPDAFGLNLAMGDHPIAWTRCIGRGRSFYSAIGHMPESYADPNHQRLLEAGIAMAADAHSSVCMPAR